MIYLFQLLKEIILEGGNVFGNTSSIRKENVVPTLKKFTQELSRIYPKVKFNFSILGSAGKKEESGDLDLALSSDHFLNKKGEPLLSDWSIDSNEFERIYQTIRSKVRSSSEAQSRVRAMIEIISANLGKESSLIVTDPKSASKGTLFCSFPQYNDKGEKLANSIQIDINIGSLDWLNFSFHSSAYKDNVKGLHRNQLVSALFKVLGLTFDRTQGVKRKEDGKIIANDSKGVMNILNKGFGFQIDQSILDDYFKLIDHIKSNSSKEDYSKIIDIFLQNLDKQAPKTDIPLDLQKYWVENRERLGLKGTYIPDNSNLAKYK